MRLDTNRGTLTRKFKLAGPVATPEHGTVCVACGSRVATISIVYGSVITRSLPVAVQTPGWRVEDDTITATTHSLDHRKPKRIAGPLCVGCASLPSFEPSAERASKPDIRSYRGGRFDTAY